VAWALLIVVLTAFAVVVCEAWRRRIRLATVLIATACSLAISVAAPLLLSRDVYTYAAYGRIEVLYHHNPYVATLASFPHDPFVAVASVQWLHSHSHYGPLFTLASAGIARTSVGAAILSFKVIAGVAVAAATAFVALAARKIRRDRAALAATLVGLNPVIVMHTVGGGHVDALIATPLAAAIALIAIPPRDSPSRALAVTVLLTFACLIKTVMVPVLVLWLMWLARPRKLRMIALHLLVVVALAAASAFAFFNTSHPFAPFVSLGGVESWASPSHFVAHLAQALGGHDARAIVEGAFALLYVVLLLRLVGCVRRRDAPPPIREWGIALLLLALMLPYLLPWYVVWFVPFLAFFEDAVLVSAGVLAGVVLTLTLVPADPFHGLTTPAVMDGVHYGAAPVLLVVLGVVASRLGGRRRGERLVPVDATATSL
jgi:hypothetical protein